MTRYVCMYVPILFPQRLGRRGTGVIGVFATRKDELGVEAADEQQLKLLGTR